MPSVARHLLFLVENEKKQIPRLAQDDIGRGVFHQGEGQPLGFKGAGRRADYFALKLVRIPDPRAYNQITEGGRTVNSLKLLVAVVVLAGLGLAQQPNPPAQSTAAFEKLKSLAGEWEGNANEGGKEIPATTSFRLVSDGSVLMDVLAPGTPHEMVTMFHMDGSDLLATHYCAAHNQPRFLLVPSSEPNLVAFEFKDATNLSSAAAPHMVSVKFTLLDANHHLEDWTFLANGQTSTRRFDFHRKA